MRTLLGAVLIGLSLSLALNEWAGYQQERHMWNMLNSTAYWFNQ